MFLLVFNPFEHMVIKFYAPFVIVYAQLFLLTFFDDLRKVTINNVYLTVLVAVFLIISYEISVVMQSFSGHFWPYSIYDINNTILIPNLVIITFLLLYLYTKMKMFKKSYKYILLILIGVTLEICIMLIMLNKFYFYEYVY